MIQDTELQSPLNLAAGKLGSGRTEDREAAPRRRSIRSASAWRRRT